MIEVVVGFGFGIGEGVEVFGGVVIAVRSGSGGDETGKESEEREEAEEECRWGNVHDRLPSGCLW